MLNYSKIRAFTQTELLCTVATLGALVSVAVPRMMTTGENAKITICKMNVTMLNRLSDAYVTQNSRFPSLEMLCADVNVFPDGPPKCPYEKPYVMSPNGHIIPHEH